MKKKEIKNKIKSKRNIGKIIYILFLITLTLGIIFTNNFSYKYKNPPKTKYKICQYCYHKNYHKKQYKKHNHRLYNKIISLEKKNKILFDKYNELSQQLSKLHNLQSKNNDNSSKIIIDYFNLISDVKKNQPHQDKLNKIKLLLNEDSELYKTFLELEKLLSDSFKNEKIIKSDFQTITKEIVQYNKPTKKQNLLNKIKDYIFSSITVRKINFKKGDSEPKVDYIIFQIEQNLKKKQYTKIITLLEEIKFINPKLINQFQLDIKKIVYFYDLHQEIINLLK